MPTLVDTTIKLSTFNVAKVIFMRDKNKYIIRILAYDSFDNKIYEYVNPYGVRSDKKANALRTNVLKHDSAFYLHHTLGVYEFYYNNRLQLLKLHNNEKD